MAKQGFHGFKWKPGGYKAVMNGDSVQRILSQEADSRAGGATARTNAHGHSGTHFGAKQVQGKFAKGCVVYPTTYEGAAHAAEALGE